MPIYAYIGVWRINHLIVIYDRGYHWFFQLSFALLFACLPYCIQYNLRPNSFHWILFFQLIPRSGRQFKAIPNGRPNGRTGKPDPKMPFVYLYCSDHILPPHPTIAIPFEYLLIEHCTFKYKHQNTKVNICLSVLDTIKSDRSVSQSKFF